MYGEGCDKMAAFSTVLITGCGGDIGQSIAKVIRSEGLATKIVGCDIHNEHAGEIVFDICKIVPSVKDINYLESLKSIIEQDGIKVVIPASEMELRHLTQLDLKQVFPGVHFVHANKKALEVGFDKLKTAHFLRDNQLLFPWTFIVGDADPVEVPCILKSRTGAGSKDVYIVEPELVPYYKMKKADYIWQQLLLPHDQEYTCGLYRTKTGNIRTIIFKRRLQGGFTVYGELIKNERIEQLLRDVARYLELKGSINIQLRLTDRGPFIFEINPRFSSTVMFRHLLGFQDVVWTLQELQDTPIPEYNMADEGTRFFRASNEIILNKPTKAER
jgi:carbamoyl-phosphate synthase large subunit